MRLVYDERVDAAFVEVAGPIVPGSVDFTDELDQDRNVKYDAEEHVLAYEFLNVQRRGVRLSDLPHHEEMARVFREAGFRERESRRAAS